MKLSNDIQDFPKSFETIHRRKTNVYKLALKQNHISKHLIRWQLQPIIKTYGHNLK